MKEFRSIPGSVTASSSVGHYASASLEGAKTLYLVGGTTGEYSDRSEWSVCLFETESAARSYVEFLTAKRQQLGAWPTDWEARDAIETAMRAFDPGFTEDYTGTTWFVSAVPLIEAAPVSAPHSADDASGRDE